MELETGLITGFTVYSEDGKIFEFFQPVFSHYTNNTFRNGDFTNRQDISSPFATSWLLTAVKGPDYVDINSNGQIDDNDYGYFVKFNYSTPIVRVWRTPMTPGKTIELDNGGNQMSWGLKDQINLTSIETSTHKAIFKTIQRKDNFSMGMENMVKFNYEVQTSKIPMGGGVFKFNITKRFLKQLITNLNIRIGLEYDVVGDKIDYYNGDIPTSVLAQLLTTEGAVLLVGQKNTDCINHKNGSEGDELEFFVGLPSGGGTENQNGTMEQLTISLAPGHCSPGGGIGYSDVYPLSIYIRSNNGNGIISERSYNNLNSQEVALASIQLINKIKDNEILNEVRFSYDYYLQPLAENTTSDGNNGRGKLTLKRLDYFANNGKSYVPSTIFEYANNPIWGKNSYDFWGHYSRLGEEASHPNAQSVEMADSDAAAWALSGIKTPSGMRVLISYESDRINQVADNPAIPTISKLSNPLQNSVTLTVDAQNPSDFFPGNRVRVTERVDFIVHVCDSVEEDGVKVYKEINQYSDFYFKDYPITTVDSKNGNFLTLSAPISYRKAKPDADSTISYTITNLDKFESVIYGGGHRVKQISLSTMSGIEKQIYFYGDGVTSTMPSALKKQFPLLRENLFYDYGFNILTRSPGVGYKKVTVLSLSPDNEIRSGKIETQFFTAVDFLLDVKSDNSLLETKHKKFITLTDLSGIIGKQKKVTNFAIKENAVGYSETDFYKTTEIDFEYRFSKWQTFESGLTKSLLYDSDGNTRKVITGLNSDKSFSIQTDPAKPLGLSSYSWVSGQSDTSWSTNMNADSSFDKIVTLNRESVYLVGTKTTKWNYDRKGQSTGAPLISVANILGLDVRTGNAIISMVSDSKRNKLVSENFPARWFYSDMYKTNQVSQIALQLDYALPYGIDYWGLNSFEQKKQYLTDGLVSTWKNWSSVNSRPIFRVKDSYTLIKTANDSQFFNFPHHSQAGDLSDQESFNYFDGWQRMSNITKYDIFSHPIEELSIGGNFSSYLFGYKQSLVFAIVSNARIYHNNNEQGNEAGYTGFEEVPQNGSNRTSGPWNIYSESLNQLSTTTAHTGVKSVFIKPSTGTTVYGPTADFLPDEQNRCFIVSCWVKTQSGYGTNGNLKLVIHSSNSNSPGIWYPTQNGTSPGEIQPISDTQDKWVWVSQKLDLSEIRKQANIPDGEKLKIRVFLEHNHSTKGVFVDDIRFHPTDAVMSTFSYDPLTWKVTSISKEDDRPSYFEYDPAGRLVVVRDHNRNIINRYSYNYGLQGR